MMKEAYLTELAQHLRPLPDTESANALAYYTEFLEEAEDTQAAIASLGSPKETAAQILAAFAAQPSNVPHPAAEAARAGKSDLHKIWISILALFSAPIALPLAIGIAVLILSLVGVLLAAYLGITAAALAGAVGGIAGTILGLVLLPQGIWSALTILGGSLLLFGLGLLLSAGIWVFSRRSFNAIAKAVSNIILRRAKK
ncbi:MAG: DUF1700 domain-containing protein [Oscillospiraceae bacterium]|jgi:uncharacterized membrane protein|nr:DUF1700 domain-containing protein [Oscillospiraceae bacterium]